MTMEYSEQIISSEQIYQIFGSNVKAYRKAQNKTQEELAAALECDQKYVSRIENGQAKPNLAICLRLANFFHVSLEFLLEGACEVRCSPKDGERLCNRKMLEEIGKVITSYMG